MKKSIKGATLVELTIVLAVLSILTMLTITFSQLVRNQVIAITTDNNIIEDWTNTRNVFDTFVNNYDNDEYDFYCDDNKLYAVNKYTSKENVLLLTDDGLFVGSLTTNSYGQNKVIYNGTRSITEIKFTIEENDNSHKLLIGLKVTYSGYNSAGTKETTESTDFYKATRVSGLYD